MILSLLRWVLPLTLPLFLATAAGGAWAAGHEHGHGQAFVFPVSAFSAGATNGVADPGCDPAAACAGHHLDRHGASPEGSSDRHSGHGGDCSCMAACLALLPPETAGAVPVLRPRPWRLTNAADQPRWRTPPLPPPRG